MRNIGAAFIVIIGLMAPALQAGAEPTFSTVPGYMAVPVVTIDGDPASYTSGVQGLDGDDEETVYMFGQNRYIMKKEPGSPAAILYDYGSAVFGSFVKLRGDTLYFGESSMGTVKSIPAGGGPAADLFALNYSYDCAFNSQTQMFLSANPSWAGNLIYAWWEGMTEPRLVAEVGDNSGPIAFDGDDNLYYGRSTAYPPGPEDIVYFTVAQVENALTTGIPLASADWTVYAAGVDAPAGLVFDRDTPVGNLFSVSAGFGTLSRISPADSTPIGTGAYPGGPVYYGPGRFSAFLNGGGALALFCTDYDDSYDSTVYLIKPCSQNFILGGGDYGSTGRSDIAVFRPTTGLWAIREVSRFYFGTDGDLPVSANYDGDGTVEPAVFRPATGLWAVAGGSRVYFGKQGDIPVPRDYDDDGSADYAVFRPSTGLWAIKEVSRIYFGGREDFPLPAHYRIGTVDIGIFRPSSGLWAIREFSRYYFGRAGDLPVPGDYDGDGTVDSGVYRPASGLWAVREVTRIYFGSGEAGDWPLPVDADGDGTTDPAIFRSEFGLWAVRGVTRIYFGTDGDFPASR